MSVYFLFLFPFMSIVCRSANWLKQGSDVTERACPLKWNQVPVKLAERPIDNKRPLTLGQELVDSCLLTLILLISLILPQTSHAVFCIHVFVVASGSFYLLQIGLCILEKPILASPSKGYENEPHFNQ